MARITRHRKRTKKKQKTSNGEQDGSAKKVDYNKRRKNALLGLGGAGVLGVGAYALMNGLGGGSGDSATDTEGGKNKGKSGSSDGSDGTGSGSGSTSSVPEGYHTKVVEVPIDNYEEAMEFATREWNKIKRENGRQLDVQVLGSCNWRTGEWCKVYLPTFDIDDFMYIIRVSQSSDGGEWSSNLTLVDYPPGWGKEQLEENNEEDEEDDTGEDSESSESSSGSSESSSSGSGETSGSGSSSDGGDNATVTIDNTSFNNATYQP